MSEEKKYTLEEAQLYFAKKINGQVWEYLQNPERSRSDDELMLYCAHASCYHWMSVGSGLHHQRAEWLIAHVCTVLGYVDSALRHAARCLELTNQHSDLMQDFDWAYAYEGMARANALAGNGAVALKYIPLAKESGQAIQDDEDRSIFLGDFNGGDWYGLR